MYRAFNQPGSFEAMRLDKLNESMLSTLLGEDSLKEESTRCFWHLIFNEVVE